MRNPSLWSVVVPRAMSIYACLIFALLWAGFVLALAVNREWLDAVWNWTQALPALPRVVIWLLFLPIMVGLWIWESSWPAPALLLGFAAIVGWTLLATSSLVKAFR